MLTRFHLWHVNVKECRGRESAWDLARTTGTTHQSSTLRDSESETKTALWESKTMWNNVKQCAFWVFLCISMYFYVFLCISMYFYVFLCISGTFSARTSANFQISAVELNSLSQWRGIAASDAAVARQMGHRLRWPEWAPRDDVVWAHLMCLWIAFVFQSFSDHFSSLQGLNVIVPVACGLQCLGVGKATTEIIIFSRSKS